MFYYLKGFQFLNELKKLQYMNLKEIKDIQLKKLKSVLNYSYEKSLFYHDLFKKNNVSPSDIVTIDDINKIPIIDKEDIKKNLNSLVTQDINTLSRHRTSGSTGIPISFYSDRNEDLFRKAKHLRANTNIGQTIFDKWVTITAPHHFGESSALQRFLNIYFPKPISVFNEPNVQINEIEAYDPRILDGYASALYVLARSVEKRGFTNVRPKFMISSAELLERAHRKYIEGVFEAPLYDQYSCVEFGRVSWECYQRVGYHMDMDNLVIQIVDDGGEEMAPGETGNVVCTSLFNFSMPLIRYAIGDLASISEEECSCDISLPLMKSIEGRQDSLIKLPHGKEMSPMNFSLAFNVYEYFYLFNQFQVVQKKKDSFKIYLNLVDDSVDVKNIVDGLQNHLYSILGFNVGEIEFDIDIVDEIPLHKSGKFKRVISEVKD